MPDTSKLEKITAFNAKASTAKSEKLPPSTTKDALENATDKASVITAKAADTKEAKAAIKAEEKARVDQEKKEETERANAVEKAGLAVDELRGKIGDASMPAQTWLANLPTPGGIATILLVILFFAFVAIPVNPQGDTRLKLMWLTITGKTHLRYTDNSSGNGTISSGGVSVPWPPAHIAGGGDKTLHSPPIIAEGVSILDMLDFS